MRILIINPNTTAAMTLSVLDAARAVAKLPPAPCATADLRLHGATAKASGDPYGTDRDILDSLPGAWRTVMDGFELTEAEIRYAARYEFARTVEDVLARRSRALFVDASLAAAAAPAVAALMAEELGRDQDWCAAQVTNFQKLARQYGADALPGEPL